MNLNLYNIDFNHFFFQQQKNAIYQLYLTLLIVYTIQFDVNVKYSEINEPLKEFTVNLIEENNRECSRRPFFVKTKYKESTCQCIRI